MEELSQPLLFGDIELSVAAGTRPATDAGGDCAAALRISDKFFESRFFSRGPIYYPKKLTPRDQAFC